MRGVIGNRRLLERAGKAAPSPAGPIQLSDLSVAGRLNAEQLDRFIDFVLDETVMLKEGIRVMRLQADRADLDKIAVGTRSLRKAVDAVEPTDLAGVRQSKRSVVVTEVILPADISFNYLEDNIERENAEEHILQLFATQFANDLEELGLIGDTASLDDFLNIEDGWLKILQGDSSGDGVGSAFLFDTDGSKDFRNVVWEGMLGKLPTKFKQNKARLRYYTSVANEEKYRFQIGQRQTTAGDQTLAGGGMMTYSGIRVVGVPFMPDDKHILTMADNLVFAIRRDITMGLFRNPRARTNEYTWTAKIDYEVVEFTAAVLALDLP